MAPTGPIGLTLPAISGESLSRVAHEFPAGLTAPATLLLVAFHQPQQREVDSWLPAVRRLAERFSGFAYFEIPMIGLRYRPLRPLIDGGMRSGIPDPDVRAVTVTAYQRVSRFLDPLRIEDTRRIVVLLVDASGVITWFARGSLSDEETARDLESAVSRLLTTGG
jgi:hypothetical protein